MLDPLKVTVVMPGGGRGAWGIPGALLTAYLAEHGVVAEKTESFSLLFLFPLGVTRAKWESLVQALLCFKRDYDADAPLARVMPRLAAAHPGFYAALGLRALASAMFSSMRELALLDCVQAAHAHLPERAMLPAEAHDRAVLGQGSHQPLAALAGGVAVTSVVPYPPGIPLLMPGERFGPANGPVLRYLAALQVLDARFPGFVHETHGVENQGGEYRALRFC
jgi:arginine/lysine/ornithine decarboxylase